MAGPEGENPKSALVKRAEAIEAAAQEAVAEALRLHKLLGNPIAVWEDEQVRWVPPEAIEVGEPTPPPGAATGDGMSNS
jgi:hypothetical protein